MKYLVSAAIAVFFSLELAAEENKKSGVQIPDTHSAVRVFSSDAGGGWTALTIDSKGGDWEGPLLIILPIDDGGLVGLSEDEAKLFPRGPAAILLWSEGLDEVTLFSRRTKIPSAAYLVTSEREIFEYIMYNYEIGEHFGSYAPHARDILRSGVNWEEGWLLAAGHVGKDGENVMHENYTEIDVSSIVQGWKADVGGYLSIYSTLSKSRSEEERRILTQELITRVRESLRQEQWSRAARGAREIALQQPKDGVVLLEAARALHQSKDCARTALDYAFASQDILGESGQHSLLISEIRKSLRQEGHYPSAGRARRTGTEESLGASEVGNAGRGGITETSSNETGSSSGTIGADAPNARTAGSGSGEGGGEGAGEGAGEPEGAGDDPEDEKAGESGDNDEGGGVVAGDA